MRPGEGQTLPLFFIGKKRFRSYLYEAPHDGRPHLTGFMSATWRSQAHQQSLGYTLTVDARFRSRLQTHRFPPQIL